MKKDLLEIIIPIAIIVGLITWQGLSQKPAVQVSCETTKGPLEIVVKPDWSPRGAERFLQLINDGYFTNLPLFRCMENFVCQFGPKPGGSAKTYGPLTDDVPQSALRNFRRGYLSFAGYAPNTRATHIFIALAPVASLGTQPWETPFGYIKESTLSTVGNFTTTYGETRPGGNGPEAQKIEAADGADYLKREFPQLDYFLSCSRK